MTRAGRLPASPDQLTPSWLTTQLTPTLGVNTQLYRHVPWERALHGIAGAGFECVGVWHTHAGGPVIGPDATPRQIATVRQQIKEASLRPALAYRFPCGSDEPTVILRRAVEVSADLGCPFVSSYGPSPYQEALFGPRKREMQYLLECCGYLAALHAVAPLAERMGVTIVLRPHSGVTGTGRDLADIVRLLGLPNIRVCYDAGNILFFEGIAPEDDLPACAEHVRVLSIKDHRGGRGSDEVPIPGEGVVDHAALFRVLLGAGFAGPCIVERIDGPQEPEVIDAPLAVARVNLERAIAAARSV